MVAVVVAIGTEAGPELDIEAGIFAVEAEPLPEHSTRTSAVESRNAAAADGVEGGEGPGYSSHSASRSWHQETCDGVFSGLLP